jgi:hypothetical protein
MSSHEDWRKPIADAEALIRKAVSQAAMSGDWSVVERLADIARTLKSFEVSEQSVPTSSPLVERDVGKKPIQLDRDNRKPRKSPKRSKRRGAYPKYAREGTALIRASWSKTKKAEYRQRCPNEVIEQLQGVLSSLTASATFRIEDHLPLAGATGDYPNYQVYIAMAWLKDAGLVIQRQRGVYAVHSRANLSQWSVLFEQIDEIEEADA